VIVSNQAQTFVSDTWVTCPKPNPQAELRLFCLPYAGSGVAIYRPWLAHLSPRIELCLVNLPGREKRLRESPYTQLGPLIETLAEALHSCLDKPFALFGHSMGALICFELARQLRHRYALQPVHLFVSAHRAPQIPDPNPPLHHLPDGAFLQALQQRYGPLPAILLQDPELMQLFLPILRADLAVIETYLYQEAPPLDCPISAFGGWQDNVATEESLSVWRNQTHSKFNLTMFPGDHFYLQNAHSFLAQHVSDNLTRYTS
jgi:medium-chain acyl-[acyl-carrier-protein] hydrolase